MGVFAYPHATVARLLLLLSSLVLAQSTLSLRHVFRGVAPADRAHFENKKEVACRDGSATFPIEAVNDNYCDCPDGTDEPGTSACPMGLFFCHNRGHQAHFVYSSRVNDGICDCCDGSDEYSAAVSCNNTCKEAGLAALAGLRSAVASQREGAALKVAALSEKMGAKEEWRKELGTLKADMDSLKEKERILNEKKEEVTRLQNERREAEEEEKRKQEEEEKKQQEALVGKQDHREGKEGGEHSEGDGMLEGGERGLESTEHAAAAAAAGEGMVDHHTEVFTAGEASGAAAAEGSVVDLEVPKVPGVAEVAPPGTDGELPPGVKEVSHNVAPTLVVQTPASQSTPPPTPHDDQESLAGLSADEVGRRVASRWVRGGAPAAEEEEDVVGEGDRKYVEQQHQHGEQEHGKMHHHDHGHDHDDDDEDHEVDGDDHDDDDDGGFEGDVDEDFHTPDSDSSEGEHQAGMTDDAKPQSALHLIAITLRSLAGRMLTRLLQQITGMRMGGTLAPEEESQVFQEWYKAQEAVRKSEERVTELEELLAADYGPGEQFLALSGKCFSTTVNQYSYEVCPFKKVTQTEHGHSATSIGKWERFSDNYTVMVFGEGDTCWNGPNRSMKVSLKCSTMSELSQVEEPSRCEYSAVLHSPVACSLEEAQKLEEELAAKLREIEAPAEHDEL